MQEQPDPAINPGQSPQNKPGKYTTLQFYAAIILPLAAIIGTLIDKSLAGGGGDAVSGLLIPVYILLGIYALMSPLLAFINATSIWLHWNTRAAEKTKIIYWSVGLVISASFGIIFLFLATTGGL